jgi:hypothetical protein
MMHTERMIERAIVRLRKGLPLPVDMTARLLEAGVDVSELERAYAL